MRADPPRRPVPARPSSRCRTARVDSPRTTATSAASSAPDRHQVPQVRPERRRRRPSVGSCPCALRGRSSRSPVPALPSPARDPHVDPCARRALPAGPQQQKASRRGHRCRRGRCCRSGRRAGALHRRAGRWRRPRWSHRARSSVRATVLPGRVGARGASVLGAAEPACSAASSEENQTWAMRAGVAVRVGQVVLHRPLVALDRVALRRLDADVDARRCRSAPGARPDRRRSSVSCSALTASSGSS